MVDANVRDSDLWQTKPTKDFPCLKMNLNVLDQLSKNPFNDI